jgi:hypothetical protein
MANSPSNKAPPPEPKTADEPVAQQQEEEEWGNGNTYAPFKTLMGLRKLDDWTFESTHPAYSPGGFTRAYGGHVYAQAVLAAARTVKKGFVVHVCACVFPLYLLVLGMEIEGQHVGNVKLTRVFCRIAQAIS